VCFDKTPHLNEKHTIFGRVVHGWDVFEYIESIETGANDKPLKDVTILDCGELKGEDKKVAE
jgi:cyclophilin family peptidyl-prolyl cis-trans isomerase